MSLSLLHIAGMVITILLILAVSLYSGRSVKNAADFDSGGGKAGAAVVSGAIMGTLVGGSSTVGTAQLAYDYGFSAWWFTLGGGIACAILAIFYVVPLRRYKNMTIVGIVAQEYGAATGMVTSLLSSVGTFINILSQLISATAVMAIIVPGLDMKYALLIAAVLMALYVIFGGVLGAGMVGIVKLILLYLSVIAGGVIVVFLSHGFAPLYQQLDHALYFNLFARGIGTDGGAGLSLILGVLSTQSYAQAVMAGKNDRTARKGALISACMIPPIGIGGILIGMYMRIHEPSLPSAKMAFPQFVVNHMPPLLAGIVLATLLIAVIGTGAGLALGISTIINNDIVKKVTHKLDDTVKSLYFSRVLLFVILGVACLLCMCPIGDTILNFSFMSMGLRGAVMMGPLCCALWMPGKVNRKWVLAAVCISPLLVLIFGITDCLPFDPLFLGVAASALLCSAGRMAGPAEKKQEEITNQGEK